MLVLTRKVTEKLYIGSDICVTVVRLEGGQVRLGIEAPRQIPVVRAELIPGPPEAVPPDDRHLPPPVRPVLRTPPVAAPGTGIRRRGPSR